MVVLPTSETPEMKALNLEIAKKSHGVCFLMFSGGKDSLCAWLFLKKYFKKVIPFHCASWPGMKHEKEYLDYVERMFGDGTHILRLVGEEVPMGTYHLVYQTPEILTSGAYDDFEVDTYSKLDILEYLRYMYNMPKAWCAVGMNIFDSIDRRIYINKMGGKNEGNLTFYPAFNLPRQEVLRTIKGSGLKLAGTYKWSSRSAGGVPSYTWNRILREHYPEDYERLLSYFPFAEAKTVRERILDRIYERRRAEGIIADEDQEGEEFDDGTDDMPGFGMNDGEGGEEE